MMNPSRYGHLAMALLLGLSAPAWGQAERWSELRNLPFPENYPTAEAVDILYDEMLFHRATQVASRMDLAVNADGSVDIFIGPDEPQGDKAKNWIPTEPGRAWFPYFRLYSPTQAFLDQSWVLPDIEKAG